MMSIPIARREWMALVYTPLGWVSLAAFALAPGIMFALGSLVSGAPVSMRMPLQVAAWCLFVTAPVLALRSITEERRAGTWETLIASPASASDIVLGKFMALVAFLGLFALPLLVQFGLLSMVARPDLGEFLCGLFGVMLAGVTVLASAIVFAVIAPGGTAAYLLTIGFWSAWMLLSRALPTVVPPDWTAIAYGIDPVRRVDDFLLGMLDPANVLFLVSMCVVFLVVAIDVVADPMRGGAARSRALPRALALVGTVALAIAATGLVSEPLLRRSVDLTRTRSWTLSERTRTLVASLEGDWRIDAIAGRDSVDAAALRQLDEVLARFHGLDTKSGRVTAQRLDPSDPAQTSSFDMALERLERIHAKPLADLRAAIDAGIEAYERLAAWAGAEANALTALLAQLPGVGEEVGDRALLEEDRAALEQWRAICTRVATDHRMFLDSVRSEARSSERAPLGDPARAAAALDTALRAWMAQCNTAETALRELRRRERLPVQLIEYLRDAPGRATEMAQKLSLAQDRLARLPELALGEVAAALRAGDAVIVSGPDRVAAIPGWQLLPPVSAEPSSFDRRFRGEEVVAGAIRALERGVAPEVIFVHGEGRSLLRPSADRLDLAAIADALRSVRCTVREWQPSAEPRPLPREGRKPVWIVIPPLRRAGIEADPRERRLLEAAARLIDSSEPMLLAVAPSVLPLIGQSDPWAELARRVGVDAQTGRTVLELAATSERQREVRAFFEIDGAAEHAASRGAAGMRTLVSEPVPVAALSESMSFVPLLDIPRAANRWLEDDWRSAARRSVEVPDSKRLDAAVSVIAAVEGERGRRAVVSGGAAWMLSGLADLTGQLGPDRVFLRYPGNRELLVGIVGWLAGVEGDFASASGREVERVPALTASVRLLVGGAAAVGIPLVALMMALGIRVRRRSS